MQGAVVYHTANGQSVLHDVSTGKRLLFVLSNQPQLFKHFRVVFQCGAVDYASCQVRHAVGVFRIRLEKVRLLLAGRSGPLKASPASFLLVPGIRDSCRVGPPQGHF